MSPRPFTPTKKPSGEPQRSPQGGDPAYGPAGGSNTDESTIERITSSAISAQIRVIVLRFCLCGRTDSV